MQNKLHYYLLSGAFVVLSAFTVLPNTPKKETLSDNPDGKKVFKQYCVACHGQKGEGTIGPNLTDEYWLHGNKLGDLLKVINNGVSGTAMVAWKNQLNAGQIQAVAKYIMSLKGTNPPNGKAPQGKRYADVAKPTTNNEASTAKKSTNVAKPTNVTTAVVASAPETPATSAVETSATTSTATTTAEPAAATDVSNDNVAKSMALTGNAGTGQRLFNAILGCSHCHGTNSVGHEDNRNLRAIKKRRGEIDPTFYDVMRNGRTGTAMPPWAHLSPKQVADLKAFVQSIQEE